MMENNIFLFKPKSELTAEGNLNNFILKCKKLNAFGVDQWDENLWADHKGVRKVTARFSTNTKPSTSYSFEPLSLPYRDFAKAYIKYAYSYKPVTNLQRHFEALRVLEEALLEVNGTADILGLDGTVLTNIDSIFRKRISNSEGLNKAGYQMELILKFCRENHFTPNIPEWSNPFRKVKLVAISVSEEGKKHRAEKLPSDEVMMQVAKLFHDAPNLGVEAEYFTAVMALLMVAPSRCSEVLSLPLNCLVWEETRAGEMKLGIRWVPAKNGKEGVKWVPTVMTDVVTQAVERLERIGEPARKAAKFAEANPNKFMRHEYCITPENFSDATPLTVQQFNAAMELNLARFTMNAPTPKWLISLLKENDGTINYKALGKYQYESFVKKFKNFPYIDNAKHIKVSEALLLHRENEYHKDFSPRPFSFGLPTVNAVNDRFSDKGHTGKSSLFAKHGISSFDGSKILIASHDARRWLSTKAERGGMDELTLANWAGRAKVSDNAKYDYRTEKEKSDESALVLFGNDMTPLDKINMNIPVSFEDIGKDLVGSAIVTELGICEHDFAMLPCQRDGDCETCKELVCIKGMDSSLQQLKKREIQVASQLSKSQQSHKMGVFGADRWVSAQGWRLTHIRTKIKILEDENTPNGTPVRIPEEYDPSPIKDALISKGLSADIQPQPTESITIKTEELALNNDASDLFDIMEGL
ncbi:integrase [Photobacterium phosphoreum]|uniref:integrase n=2 Tax=Photobacterium phosphoreum TaxID=659 RepID=UPI001E5883E0|nr:integrase [Photobacterium phosphoreum]